MKTSYIIWKVIIRSPLRVIKCEVYGILGLEQSLKILVKSFFPLVLYGENNEGHYTTKKMQILCISEGQDFDSHVSFHANNRECESNQ